MYHMCGKNRVKNCNNADEAAEICVHINKKAAHQFDKIKELRLSR